MKVPILFMFVLIGATLSAVAQTLRPPETATVVVFTPGGHWRGFRDQLRKPLFAKAKMTSMGFIFEGDRKVAWLSHSRYLVLQTSPGVHTFSTIMSGKEPDPKTVVTVTLKAGGVSYLALTSTARSFGVVATQESGLSLSTCNEFVEANADHTFEAVREKDIEKPFRGAVSTVLPAAPCPQ